MSVAERGERTLAEMLAEAARVYGDPDAALKLRTMLMQYDTVKKSKGAVVTVPSAFADGFADAAGKGADGTRASTVAPVAWRGDRRRARSGVRETGAGVAACARRTSASRAGRLR